MTITLYSAPGSCSQVAMTALEEAGVVYDVELVRFVRQEHMTPEYRARNPLGKVPSLSVDDRHLRENVAIISWLNTAYPEARLLPPAGDDFEAAQQIADLCFCSSTLHPIVTRIALPMMFGPKEAIPDIRALAEAMMRRFLAVVEARLEGQDFWFAEGWSMMDAYLGWVITRITGVGFDMSSFPRLVAMMARQSARPSVMRVTAKVSEHAALLEREGAALTAESAGAAIERSAVQSAGTA